MGEVQPVMEQKHNKTVLYVNTRMEDKTYV